MAHPAKLGFPKSTPKLTPGGIEPWHDLGRQTLAGDLSDQHGYTTPPSDHIPLGRVVLCIMCRQHHGASCRDREPRLRGRNRVAKLTLCGVEPWHDLRRQSRCWGFEHPALIHNAAERPYSAWRRCALHHESRANLAHALIANPGSCFRRAKAAKPFRRDAKPFSWSREHTGKRRAGINTCGLEERRTGHRASGASYHSQDAGGAPQSG